MARLFKVLGGVVGSVKKTSLFLGGSINSEIQSGCCAGWIFSYCRKELERGCGTAFLHRVFSSLLTLKSAFLLVKYLKQVYILVLSMSLHFEELPHFYELFFSRIQ